MLLALRSLWEDTETPAEQTVHGAAVLPRHIILEKMEEEAMLAAMLAED